MKQEEKQAVELYLERLRLIREGTAVNPFETPEEKATVIERMRKDVAFLSLIHISEPTRLID